MTTSIPSFRFSTQKSPIQGFEIKSLDFISADRAQTGRIHRTEFFQLIYLEMGELNLAVDFEELKLVAGEALLISPSQVKQFLISEGDYLGVSILFMAEFFSADEGDSRLLSRLALRPRLTRIRLGADFAQPLLGLLNLASQMERHANQIELIRSLLRALLLELDTRLEAETSLGFGRTGDLGYRFCRAVEEHYQRLYNVSDYLSLLGIQSKALAQATQSTLGLTPKAYIDQRRTLEAKRLLAHSTLSIKEISFTLGFDDQTNFSKYFLAQTGERPSSFRDRQA